MDLLFKPLIAFIDLKNFSKIDIMLPVDIIADENIPFVKEAFSTIGEVKTIPGRKINPEIIKKADILLVRSITQVNRKLLESSPVKFIATATIGFDHVDMGYLEKRNIGFSSAPGSNSNSVAEYIIACLLLLGSRGEIPLENIKLGVVGIGNVGSKVVRKAIGLGVKVVQNDPPRARESRDPVFLDLDDLMDCDVVSLHVPMTEEGTDKTFKLFDSGRISKMKKGSILINTSRGGIVEEAALKNFLKSAHLKGAVLDVWENEPDIDTGMLEMVDIGTPHIAGYSFDGKVNGTVMIYKAACDFFNIKPSWQPDMPPPPAPAIKVNGAIDKNNYLKKMSAVVKRIYNIESDDSGLRKLLRLNDSRRAGYFDNLRKLYPVRREFQNTKLNLDIIDTVIKDKFKAIGFNI